MKILIVKNSSLGDIIHTFPCIQLIRKALPEITHLAWVVNDFFSDAVSLCPGVDRIIPFPRKKLWNPGAIKQFINELRQETYDMVIDYQGLLRSGLICFCARSPQRIGFSHAREMSPLFYTRKIKVPKEIMHAIDKNLYMTRDIFGLQAVPLPTVQFLLSQDDMTQSHALLAPNADKLRLGICFSSSWESKNWPLEFLADILDNLQNRVSNLECVLLGSAKDQKDGERLRQLTHQATVINTAGKTTLRTMAALLSEMNGMLTVDSGPMHIASALGIPCVALFGATHPQLTGPYGENHTIIQSLCRRSPCFQHHCPLASDCSSGIDAADVARILAEKITTPSFRKKP